MDFYVFNAKKPVKLLPKTVFFPRKKRVENPATTKIKGDVSNPLVYHNKENEKENK